MDCDVLRQVIAVNLRTALKLVGVVRNEHNLDLEHFGSPDRPRDMPFPLLMQ